MLVAWITGAGAPACMTADPDEGLAGPESALDEEELEPDADLDADAEHLVAEAGPTTTHVHVEIPRVSLETYVELAPVIAHVRVGESTVVEPDGARPYTEYEVEVLTALSGEVDSTIAVRVGSVQTPRRRVVVDHAPGLVAGEELVLFLDRHEDAYVILGLDQGTYQVDHDPEGRAMVDGLHARQQSLDAFTRRLDQVRTTLAQQEIDHG